MSIMFDIDGRDGGEDNAFIDQLMVKEAVKF